MKKYFIALFLALAFILTPVLANAQTIAELQAQVEALMAQIAQLNAQQGNSNTWCHTFNTNLSIGMSGNEVSALQRALGLNGFNVGATGSYDERTASAVSGFQEKYRREILTPLGLANPTGYFGPSTRAVMNRLYGCNGNIVVPPSSATSATSAVTRQTVFDVVDSSTSASLENATVRVENLNGSLVATRQTGGDGETAGIPLAVGNSFTALVNKAGYITQSTRFTVGRSSNPLDEFYHVPAVRLVRASATPPPPATPTLTVTKTGFNTGLNVVMSNPGSINCGITCSTSINSGTVVTLTAFAVSGSTFAGWSGSLNSAVNPITIAMNGDKSVTANFTANTATPPSTPTITFTSPTANAVWAADQGHTIYWSTNGVGGSNSMTLELLTPSNGSVPGFNAFTTANDYNESMSLSSVSPGWYYFRLKTTVNGQTIYGGSGVFQIVGTNTTIPPPPPAPATYYITGSLGTTGATVSINGGGSCSVSSSNYTCSNIPSGADVTITPSKSGGTFSPTNVTHHVIGNLSGVNFTFTTTPPPAPATRTFRLRIVDSVTMVAISGATVALSATGQFYGIGPTDASGYTSTVTFPEGTTYTGIVTKSGYQTYNISNHAVTSGYGANYVLTINLTK